MWKQGWPTCCLTRCTAPDVHKIVSRHQHSAQCATTAQYTTSTEHSAQCATTSLCTAHKCGQIGQKSNGKNERPVKWSFVSVAGQGGQEQVYWTRGARETYLASVLPVHCTRSLFSYYSHLWSVLFGNAKNHSAERWLLQGAWGQEESLTSEAKYPVVRQNASKGFF